MADKFEDLRTYTTVVDCGGINAAAAELGIAKSAVSRRLSDLEKRLGVSLVERTTRKFALTAVGREYFRRATDLLAALDRLDGDVGGREAQEEISISADHGVLTHVVAPALTAFRSSHSDVTTRLQIDSPDADLIISDTAPKGREGVAIASVTRMLCASPDYLAERGAVDGVADLADHVGIINLGQGDGWLLARGARRVAGRHVHAPDDDIAIALAVAGIGIAQIPDYAARNFLEDGRLVVLLEDENPAPSMLLVHHAADATVAVRAFADHLAARLHKAR